MKAPNLARRCVGDAIRGGSATIISVLVMLTMSMFASGRSMVAHGQTPNLVLIIADDLGYGETGMMGETTIATPGIDALAASGVRCTNAYVTSSYCSPSRAGLFSGRYQASFGYDQNPTGERNFWPGAGLPEHVETFVTRLNDHGYATSMFGKWHLGATPQQHPMKKGFDTFFGFLHEGHYYVNEEGRDRVWTMIRDRSMAPGTRSIDGTWVRGNYAPIDEPQYDADNPIIDGTAVASVDAYLTDEITRRAVERIIGHGRDEQPFAMVVSYSAVHSPMQALTDDVPNSDDDLHRRIFAGMLTALDRGVSDIRSAIDDGGMSERTLIVFISDNGGPTGELTSKNDPLRGEKGSLYEGGIRVPMVWSMPTVLPSAAVESNVISSLDIAPTLLMLAGIGVPGDYDGIDVAPWLGQASKIAPDSAVSGGSSADPTERDRTLHWRMPRGKAAMRRGRWKLVRPGRAAAFELYDLHADVGETTDLATNQPDVHQSMVDDWERWNDRLPPIQPLVRPVEASR